MMQASLWLLLLLQPQHLAVISALFSNSKAPIRQPPLDIVIGFFYILCGCVKWVHLTGIKNMSQKNICICTVDLVSFFVKKVL